MRPKSDYAIVLSCNKGYSFGMMATMNAQNYFKTNADWEIAYDIERPTDEAIAREEREKRERISEAFPFNVNWTPVSELLEMFSEDIKKRSATLNRMWLAYWILAYKLLKEKKYKAVCVIQADEFVCENLDVYFKIADHGVLVCSEHSFTGITPYEMPFGNDKAITDPSQCGVFDAINFFNQDYADMPKDAVLYQCADPVNGRDNDSVVAWNRAVCKHGRRDHILGLDRHTWVADSIFGNTRLNFLGNVKDKIFNNCGIQMRGIHNRWWQPGRCLAEWRGLKKAAMSRTDPELKTTLDNLEHNFGLVKRFMEKFNDMTPSVKSEEYLHGEIRRPRYELGESDE